MPAIATKPTGTAKHESEVQVQLDRVVRRIRTHDLLCGTFLLGVVAFSYLAVVMTLDRWLELPGWARQLGFVGLLAALGVVTHYGIVRPWQRRVNPLYAAREVEGTVDDAKNSVVNWVDLQDKPMSDGVRAVVAARAAKQFKDADLDKAGESKRLLWLGGALGVLVVVLAALFMVFKPAVFSSLFGRAVNPFSSGAIATRTQIEIVEPKDRDLTVTAGQPVTIAVQITGKVPDADAPDRLLVLLRHNQADDVFEEVPLEAGAATREWTVRLPERLVQNGFWYRVRGGDAETAEHRVTVRPKPTLSDFEVKYEYPEYLRMKPDTVKSPHLEAHRGTVVTITAKANRTLKDGRAVLSNQPAPIPAELLGEQKDGLRVRLPLTDSGTYRLLFQSTDGEANTDAAVYDLRVLTDQPPTATITSPKEEETTLAVNDTLTVDALIGDDFGIDKVTMRFKLTAPNQPAKSLKAKPYQNGQSFKRDADGTFPTALDSKDSVALPTLTDDAGQAVELKPDMVLEYWLEALDNCTVPQANLGKSKVQKVRLTPAKVEPKQQEELKQQADKRKRDEAAHRQQQKQKLDKEARPEKESPQKPNAEPQGDKPEGQPGVKANEEPATKPGAPMDNDAPMPKATEPMNDPQPKEKGAQAAAEQDLQKQADDINKKLDDLEKQAGEAKGNDQPQPGQEAASGEKKAKPTAAPEPGEQKPAGEGDKAATGDKAKGEAKPEPTADAKPMGDGKPSPMNPNEKTNGGDPQEKPGPLGGAGGQEKPAPQPKTEPKAGANEPMPKNEPGGEGKAAAGEKKDKPDGAKPESQPMNDAAPQDNPAGSAKKNGQPKPSDERPGESPKDAKGGDAKTEKPTPAGQAKKGPPPDADKPMGEPKGGEPKPMPNDQAGEAATGKNEGQAQPQGETKKAEGGAPMGDQKAQENPWKRGTEKPSPQDANGGERQAGAEDRAEQKGREEAAKDLAGDDKQKQQAARDKLDKDIGPENRKKLEDKLEKRKNAAENLNSKDEQKRLQGEEQLKDLQREQMEGGKEEERKRQQGDAEELNRKDEIQKAAKDLNSDDKDKREAAEKKLDELVGKDAREKATKMRDDLKSGDKDRQQAAQDELNELQKKAKQQDQKAGKQGEPGDAKEQAAKQKANEEAMKDLAGNDEKKKDDARKTLDKNVGEDARKQAEKNLDDRKQAAEKLASKDEKAKQEGKAQAEKLQREQIERGRDEKTPKDADRLDRKQLEEAVKDLNSDDADKKKAAQDKLDKHAGKDAREKAEQMMKDLQSGDKDRQKAAMDELQKIQKEAEKRAQQNDKNPKGEPPLTKEDVEKLAKAAEDLNSKDDAKRKAAEKQLDDKLGEQARKELQEQMKNGQEPSPEQTEAAKKAIEDLAKNVPKPGRGPNDNQRDPKRDGGIGNTTDESFKRLEANKEFDKQAGQLQLEKLKKAEANKELLKKLGYTDEEYKRFLDGFDKMVREMPEPKDEKADAAKAEAARPTTRVDGSGTVGRRSDGSTSATNAAGVTAAPPGYGDAQKKFTKPSTATKDEPKK